MKLVDNNNYKKGAKNDDDNNNNNKPLGSKPEWPGLLPSNLEGNSSNPHKSIVEVFPFLINLSECSFFLYP